MANEKPKRKEPNPFECIYCGKKLRGSELGYEMCRACARSKWGD